MDPWDVVIGLYETLAAQPPPDRPQHTPACQGMRDLAEHIRARPEFAGVEPGLAGLTLALGLPDVHRRVYVAWQRPYVYAVYLDFCEDYLLRRARRG